MSRFLALDWDQNQLHVVAGHAGRRGFIADKAAAWRVETPPTAEGAELLGRALKDMLKAAGIAPAPVVACLSRSNFVIKEIWHPPVAPVEEAALIRFQAAKELADSTEDVVIDYTNLGPVGNGSSEIRSLALALRKSVLNTYQTLCKAANLPLAAVAPRAFGIAAALERDGGASLAGQPHEPVSPTAPVAVLNLAESWAEFAVVSNHAVVYSRSLPTTGNLAGEVRRNLALFAGQSSGAEPVGALYVAGNGEHAVLRSQLHAMLGIPTLPLDPFAREERIDLVGTDRRGGFTGGVGLLQLTAANKLPIDFAHPKEPKPPADPNKKRVLVAAAVLLLVIGGLGLFARSVLAERTAEVAELNNKKNFLDSALTAIQTDYKHYEALKGWNVTAVSWLDEVYDLAARWPKRPGLKVTQLKVETVPPRSQKDNPTTRLKIDGLYYPEDAGYLNDFVARVRADKSYLIPSLTRIGESANSGEQKGARPQNQFTITIEAKQRPAEAYSARLDPSALNVAAPKGNQKGKGNKGGGKGGKGFGGWGDQGGDE